MINKANMRVLHLGLKIETPVFIGGDPEENINRTQYYYDKEKNRIAVIDQRKFAMFLDRYNLFDFYRQYIIRNSTSKRGQNINDWLNQLSRMKIRFDKNVLNKATKYYVKTDKVSKNSLNDINCFIKDVHKSPYIPGSSIKGALRTAVIVSEITKNRHKYKRYWNDIKRAADDFRSRDGGQAGKKIERAISRLESEVLDYTIGSNEFKGMSGLSVSDTTAFSTDNLVVLPKKDISVLKRQQKENSLSLHREYALPDTKVAFDLRLDMNNKLHIKSLEDIYSALDDMYNLLYGYNGLFKSVYPVEKILPDDIIKDSKGVLMMGGGGGYHTKVILAALAPSHDELRETVKLILHKNIRNRRDDLYNHLIDDVISPRTIKLAEYNGRKRLVGLCRIYKTGDRLC
ncbi:MAG: type III-A CRISPR-associated RAMP protein Csm5 [Clostridia bacterium]|nr:type III-A CRISPR-associated RAMP protein Csm5 [Clostridia bacterium]